MNPNDLDLADRVALMRTLPQRGRVVEVGVEQGKFARVILAENHPRKLYLVDSWCTQPGTEWQEKDPAARTDHEENYRIVRQLFANRSRVKIIRATSLAAAATFEDESLDIVYIDADHTRAAEDIAAWWPKVKSGGWLCGHDYAMNEWITVQRDVDEFAAENGLPLLTTREPWPSWAVQKRADTRVSPNTEKRADTWVSPNTQNGEVAIVMTVYPPYADLLPRSVQAIDRYWPNHPPLHVGQDQQMDFAARMLADVRAVEAEFVVVLHEDFRVCAPVKEDLFDLCLATLRPDPGLLSCSLTWEPCNTGIYHFRKAPYNTQFQIIPMKWNYAVNFQARIWRRESLMRILERIPLGTSNANLEPLATQICREILLEQRIISYAFPEPPNPSTFVDEIDKSNWIVPYNNLVHAGNRNSPARYPVYINNYNRLSTTRNMIAYLLQVPDALPIIIDNDSHYPALLEWYEACPVQVIRLCKNVGPQAPWQAIRNLALGGDYYVVTDADLDLTGIPFDLLQVLRSGLELYPERIKVGLSLEIDDLPAGLESTAIVQAWEKKFWIRRIDGRWWEANVDTTLAMYRAGEGWGNVYPALRADRPYTARHVPWYRIESDEERYFDGHSDKRWSTWSNWETDNPARARVLQCLKSP